MQDFFERQSDRLDLKKSAKLFFSKLDASGKSKQKEYIPARLFLYLSNFE